MRLIIAAVLTVIAAPVVHAAPVDPYQWCAVYPPGDITNCYFVSLEQCRLAVSGQSSGYCRRNLSYIGSYREEPTLTQRRHRS
jgi:Protein of unknown function (DUF3551)